jgi:hypothetical protein
MRIYLVKYILKSVCIEFVHYFYKIVCIGQNIYITFYN